MPVLCMFIELSAEWLDHLSEQKNIDDTAIPDDLHVQSLQDLQDQQPPEFNEG